MNLKQLTDNIGHQHLHLLGWSISDHFLLQVLILQGRLLSEW